MASPLHANSPDCGTKPVVCPLHVNWPDEITPDPLPFSNWRDKLLIAAILALVSAWVIASNCEFCETLVVISLSNKFSKLVSAAILALVSAVSAACSEVSVAIRAVTSSSMSDFNSLSIVVTLAASVEIDSLILDEGTLLK